MRKIAYLTAAVLFSLTACTKEESPMAGSSGCEIQFSSGVVVETKSSAAVDDTDTTVLKTNGFRVAGIWKGTTEYLNGTVSYNSLQKKYKLDEVKYWPSEGSIDFYAVYPTSTVINTTVPDTPFIVFEADGETDLVTSMTTVPNQAVADIPFNHSLAQVSVRCRGESGVALSYTVKRVQVISAKRGKFDFTSWYDLSSSTRVLDIYDGLGISVSSDTDFTDIEGTVTVLPGPLTLKIEYEVYQNGLLIGEQEATAVMPESEYPVMGHSNVFQCTLSNDASEIQFTVTVNDWLSKSYDIVL